MLILSLFHEQCVRRFAYIARKGKSIIKKNAYVF